MAFPAGRSREAAKISAGDQLLLYTTRGCFHNPTRDRGRVVGTGVVTSPVTALDEARIIAGRQFAVECTFELAGLAPRGAGVEIAPLVPQLAAFPNPDGWKTRLRTALLPLPLGDAQKLSRLLSEQLVSLEQALASYGVAK